MAAQPSEFKCILCGECCRGDQKVWLNPADMERLARHLNLGNSDKLIELHIVSAEPGEHGVSRPRLSFSQTPVGPACRFLVNDLDENERLWGKCSLHGTDAKPLVCRLAPLSREIDLVDGVEVWAEVPPVIDCPGWEENPPPAGGRNILPPKLTQEIRADLDMETEYFQKLSANRS